MQGSYKYGGAIYSASPLPYGSNMKSCRDVSIKALKVNESICTSMKCTFGGVWNGGGGDGQRNLFVASFFFDRAAEVYISSGKDDSVHTFSWVIILTYGVGKFCCIVLCHADHNIHIMQVGFINATAAPVAKVRPADFESAARDACETGLEDAKSKYTSVSADNLPYLCMDLVYQFTLLVDGFGK